jgi:hypothetical protein
LDVSSVPLSLTIVLHVAVDEAQGAAPSYLSCFGGKAIAFVALEAVISVIGVTSTDGCFDLIVSTPLIGMCVSNSPKSKRAAKAD